VLRIREFVHAVKGMIGMKKKRKKGGQVILCFELSMPNIGSWNGKWTGEGRPYVIVKNFGRSKKATKKAQKILEKGYFHYNFGDGWAAGVSVRDVDSKEAQRLRRKSCGFSGYDWMVQSIQDHGEIKTGER